MTDTSIFKRKSADDSPGFLLYRVTILWQQKLGMIFDTLGINQTQYAILASLKYFEENGLESTQTNLVTHAHIDKMTLSKSVRQLEKGGLVVRQISPSDSRAMLVHFSAKGRKLIVRAIREVENADEEFFGCMSALQRGQFKEISLALIRGNFASEA